MSRDPTVEDAFAWLRSGAVAPDLEMQRQQALNTEDFDYRAKAMQATFGGEAGRVALETILKVSLFRAPVDHRLPTEAEYLRFAQLRQGQNQLAAAILAYLDHAQSLDQEKSRAPAPVPAAPPDHVPGAGGSGEPGSPEWWGADFGGADIAVTG